MFPRTTTQDRRRAALVFKVLFGIVAAVAAGIVLGLGMAKDRIHTYEVDVVVLDDGSALVRETIEYDFGIRAGHGIMRQIPGSSAAITDVTAQSASAPDQLQVSGRLSYVELRIGDPDRTIRGSHRYVIEYRLNGVVVGDAVAIDAIGTEWDVPIGDVAVTIAAPFDLEQTRCNQGRRFSVDSCDRFEVDGNMITVSADALARNEGITIYADVGAAASDAPTAMPDDVDLGGGDSTWWLRAMAAALAVGTAGYALGLTAVAVWARRVGRDQAWHGGGGPADAVFGGPGVEVRPIADTLADEHVTIQFVPPPDLAPAQGGSLLEEGVNDGHRVAWLMQYAIDGWFEIETDSGTTVLTWTAPDEKWAEAPPALQRIFQGRHTVSLNKYNEKFAGGWQLIGGELRRWRDTCGLWDRAAEQRSRRVQRSLVFVTVLAALVGVITMWATVASNTSMAIVAAALTALFVGAGVAAVANDSELPVRTPVGFALRQHVEGFRRFFQASEARHAEEAAERGVLREYSAWAIALGQLDRWNRAIAAAAIPPSEPGLSDFTRMVALNSAAKTATTPPSSSGSGGGFSGGFSGGGGVGGGAGGGGGGRW